MSFNIELVKWSNNSDIMLLKTESDVLKIKLADLIYIIYRDEYFSFFLKTEIFLIEGNWKDLLRKLPKQFIPIYKQTIVNLDFIEKIEPQKRRIILENSCRHKISVKQLATICEILDIKSNLINN